MIDSYLWDGWLTVTTLVTFWYTHDLGIESCDFLTAAVSTFINSIGNLLILLWGPETLEELWTFITLNRSFGFILRHFEIAFSDSISLFVSAYLIYPFG